MAKTKYPISKEFAPFDRFMPSLNPSVIATSQRLMGVPRFVWRDPDLAVVSHHVAGYEGEPIEVLIMIPRGAPSPAPCFVDIHGGGFILEAGPSHYQLAMAYAKGAHCVVMFPRYRLAPKFPFPVPQEDCYCVLRWVFENAEDLGVDVTRIGVGGDSAGGALAVNSCLNGLDRDAQVRPLFQLLVYPWLDGRNDSESFKRFTDTPMWNSSLSVGVGPLINPNPETMPLAYRSPIEAAEHAQLPSAYIEVAEFDCLHDDGMRYAELLRESGIEVEYHETHGTMHGFDTKVSAPTTQEMLAKRIAYLNRMFER